MVREIYSLRETLTKNFDVNSTNVTESNERTNTRTNERMNIRTDKRQGENYIPRGINAGGITRAPNAGANARLYLHLENSKSKNGHNFVKKNWRIISPTGMGSPFDSEQLF